MVKLTSESSSPDEKTSTTEYDTHPTPSDSNEGRSRDDMSENSEYVSDSPLCLAEQRMIEMIDDVFDRKTDILQLFPKKQRNHFNMEVMKCSRTVLLFDDFETTLVQDCMSIEELVRRILKDYSNKKRKSKDSDGTCAICRDALEGSTPTFKRVLNCGHEYHCTCIREAFIKSGSRCPMCRHDFFWDYTKDNMADTPFENYENKFVIGSITRFDV